MPRNEGGQARRIGQRELLPRSAQNISFGNIINLTTVASASFTVNDGSILTTGVLTLGGDFVNVLFGETELTAYIGSVSAANKIPGGSAIDESLYSYWNWFHYRPTNPVATTDTLKAVVFRNNSGSAVTFILYAQGRLFGVRDI